MEIRYKKLDDNAVEPYRRFDVDAGFDLTAIWKGETEKYAEYGTGIAFEIPVGYVGFLFPRSSVRNQDLMLKNSVGVVDASYRGEIKFSFANIVHDVYEDIVERDSYLTNHLSGKYPDGKGIDIHLLNRNMNKYEIGERCGQIVFIKLPEVTLVETDVLTDTDRGTDGYGSSGK